MPFLGSEALAAGAVNRYQLNTRHDMLHRNVFVPRGAVLTPVDRAVAAWLWSGRRGVAAGLSAAALHGSRWIDPRLPAELNQPSRHKTNGIILHSDHLAEDDVYVLDGMRVTTPARSGASTWGGRNGGSAFSTTEFSTGTTLCSAPVT